MALQDGFPSANGLADANDVRLALAGLITRDSSGNPRTGIFFRNTDALVTSTATMNSSVAAFEAALSRSGQGVILLPNTGATNVPHDAAPVANSRYDTIYVKQNDAVSPNADASNLPVFGILKGAPSVSPTLPTYATAKVALDAAPGIGAGAEPLTAVLIPSTATSMQSAGVAYTQLYQYTAASGGTVPFLTKAKLDLWTTAQTGQYASVVSDSAAANGLYRWAGEWKKVLGDTGWLDLTTSGWTQTSTPQIRKKNGVVYFRGIIQAVGSQTNITTLPSGFYDPARPIIISLTASSNTNIYRGQIANTGVFSVVGGMSSGNYLYLDGSTPYLID